jgi:hypothetical protein
MPPEEKSASSLAPSEAADPEMDRGHDKRHEALQSSMETLKTSNFHLQVDTEMQSVYPSLELQYQLMYYVRTGLMYYVRTGLRADSRQPCPRLLEIQHGRNFKNVLCLSMTRMGLSEVYSITAAILTH